MNSDSTKTPSKLWPISRTKKNLVLFCAGLIVISLLRMAIM